MQVEGTAATTAKTAQSTSHTFNLPSSIAAGEQICVMVLSTSGSGVTVTSTGYTVAASFDGSASDLTLLTKTAGGSEPSTITVTTSNSVECGGVAWRMSGFSAVNATIASGTEASEDPFTLSANAITGASTGDFIVTAWGVFNATRTIVTLDSNQTLIGSEAAGNYSCHVAYETGVTANSAYSTDMSGTRAWDWLMVRIEAAGGGGGGGVSSDQTATPRGYARGNHRGTN